MPMKVSLPSSWQRALAGELEQPYFRALGEFVDRERRERTVYPPEEETFAALELTPPNRVRVLLLGQDPYHRPGQAHGLAFSVRPGVRPPPSLANVFRELRDELGCSQPASGSLVPWARRGVLLLNTVLTVREGEPNSHSGRGWERFTSAVIRAVAEREETVAFVLWGAPAGKKAALVGPRHFVHRSAHPSPLSAKRGFFGSRPFGAVNRALEGAGREPVEWCLPGA
jgi:uracil-DNA glycosylase